MRGNAGEQRPRIIATKQTPCGAALGEHSQTGSHRGHQIRGQGALVTQKEPQRAVAVLYQRSEETLPRGADLQLRTSALQVVISDRGGPVRQRVPVGDLWDG